MALQLAGWANKVAIVTGASSGIGAGIADLLVENGLRVVGIARRVEKIEKRAKELQGKKGQLYGVKADLRNEAEILQAFKRVTQKLGPVHILINNAGTSQQTSLIDGETEKWQHTLDINVLGLCITTREAIKIMRANNIDGQIIHINSVAGHIVPNIPDLNVYAGTKHAVTALTETLRQELNRIGSKIKITSISPGLVESEMTFLSDSISSDAKAMIAKQPFLKPQDIANAILYVLSTPPHVQIQELTIKPVGELF